MAVQRLAKVKCAILLDITADGNAMVSCSEFTCEGQCDEDSESVSFSEAQRLALVMAMRR